MPLECKDIQKYQLLNVVGMQGYTKYQMLNAIGVQGGIGTLPLVCEIKALVTTGCPPPKPKARIHFKWKRQNTAQGQNTFQMRGTKNCQRLEYISIERDKIQPKYKIYSKWNRQNTAQDRNLTKMSKNSVICLLTNCPTILNITLILFKFNCFLDDKMISHTLLLSHYTATSHFALSV